MVNLARPNLSAPPLHPRPRATWSAYPIKRGRRAKPGIAGCAVAPLAWRRCWWFSIAFKDRLICDNEILALDGEHTASHKGDLMHGVPGVCNPHLMGENVTVECVSGASFSWLAVQPIS